MTKKVITLSPNQTIKDAFECFSNNKISGAPVVEQGKLVGIISESDLVKKVGDLTSILKEGIKEAEEKLEIKIKEIMTKEVKFLGPEDTVWKAIKLMNKHDINRLPVMEKERLVGLVSRADLVSAISKELAQVKLRVAEGVEIKTDVDRLLALVNERGEIDLETASKELKIPSVRIEGWARILDEHGLLELKYSGLGKSVLVKK